MGKWHQRLSQQLTIPTSSSTTTPDPCMHTLRARETSCLQSGNKWRSIRYWMDFWVAELSGTKRNKKIRRRSRSLMHGPAGLLRKEESLTSHPWRPSCLDITRAITRPNSSYSTRRRGKSGKSYMNRIGHSTSCLHHSTKWDISHSTIDWSRRDSKGAWTCTSVQE